jgi:cysteine desulfurase
MFDCARHCYGNPASWHRLGVEAAKVVERSRQTLAEALGAEPSEIVFTSGGTEANNLAVKGAAWAAGRRGKHVVISAVEHPSVAAAALALQRWGIRVTVVGVDATGLVDPAAVARALTADTILVSVMHANNEIGTIEPVTEIGRLCRRRGVLFHCDACQSFTKEPLDVAKVPVAMASINAHKLHGPKGVGALYVRKGTTLAPLLDGGGQEGGLRSGTLNTPAIAGFAAAVESAHPRHAAAMRRLRDRLWRALQRAVPGIRLNGPRQARLCNNLNVMLPETEAKPLLQKLSAAGICASAGAACASARPQPSPVLLAIGLSPQQAARSLRLSLSRFTTQAQVDAAVRAIARFRAGS